MTEKAYDVLAEWFEYLNDDCGYEQWSQYLITALRENGSGRVGADIGCGSGYFTRQLYRAGFSVTGIDVSEAMLDKAQRLSRAEGCNIPYVLQDVTALKGFKKLDFVTAVNDCFNYVKKEKLPSAFQKIRSALKKGGLFFFDVSSEKKLTSLPPISIDDREDVTYFSFNGREGDVVTMDVTLFIKEQSGYVRRDERHTQYIYREEELLQALSAAGFEIVFVRGHLGSDKAQTERLEFLVRKV